MRPTPSACRHFLSKSVHAATHPVQATHCRAASERLRTQATAGGFYYQTKQCLQVVDTGPCPPFFFCSRLATFECLKSCEGWSERCVTISGLGGCKEKGRGSGISTESISRVLSTSLMRAREAWFIFRRRRVGRGGRLRGSGGSSSLEEDDDSDSSELLPDSSTLSSTVSSCSSFSSLCSSLSGVLLSSVPSDGLFIDCSEAIVGYSPTILLQLLGDDP